MISVMVSVVIDGVRTKRSIYNSVVDEVLSIGEASARDDNEMRRKALLCEIQLLNQFGATSWRDRKVDRTSLPPLLRAAKNVDGQVLQDPRPLRRRRPHHRQGRLLQCRHRGWLQRPHQALRQGPSPPWHRVLELAHDTTPAILSSFSVAVESCASLQCLQIFR